MVNRDYEGEIKTFGDTVRINNIGGVTISSYTKGTTNLTPEFLDGAGQTLNIDQAKYFYFAVDDVDKAQIKPQVMQMAMKEAAWGVADATDTHLAAKLAANVDSANTLDSGSTRVVGVGAGDADAFETLIDLKVAMDKKNVPYNDRWVVVDPNFIGLLLKDPRFTSFGTDQNRALAVGGPGVNTLGGEVGGAMPEGLGGGIFSKMIGMSLYVSNNVPTTGSGASTTYSILAGFKGAATYAESIAEGQPEAFRLQTGFSDAVRGLHVYGSAVPRPNALALVYVIYS